jgi:hypothetical protein
MPPPFTNDPNIAQYLRDMEDRDARQREQMGSLMRAYKRISAQFYDNKLELSRLSDALAKAAKRIRYIEDIPGKRVPYFMNFEINIPGPDQPSLSLAGKQLMTTQPISQDGPFVCTTYLSAMLMKTYSIGPYGTADDGRPGDPSPGTEVITPLTGRFRPVASTADPFSGAYIGAGVGPVTIAGAQAVQTFRPGVADFLFEIFDASVDRNRQNNIPIPSRYIFSEFDRPLYLPISDFFSQSAVIQFKATLTRDLGFAEVNYAALPNGFAEGLQQPPPNPSAVVNPGAGRAVVALGGTLYFTMLGYKILQAQSPAT